MLAVVLSLLAAASNAGATILQRRAARSVPDDDRFRLAMVRALLRKPTWLAGIGCVILGFVFQASALGESGLTLVQPILVTELPLTLLLATWVSHRAMDRYAWGGMTGVGCGITMVLLALQPQPGGETPSSTRWMIALAAVAVVVGTLTVLGRSGGPAGAALLGTAAGVGFGATAALMKSATQQLTDGIGAVLSEWQVYGMAVVGLFSLYLLQNALQSGTLVAAQPAVTVSDPVVGVLLGVVLFDDRVREGGWLVLTAAGFAVLALASVTLSRSQAMSHVAEPVEQDVRGIAPGQ